MEEQILLSDHFELRNEQSGPRFSELQEKIETEKHSGWGFRFAKLFGGRKKFLVATVLMFSFTAGVVSTESLPANLNDIKSVLYSGAGIAILEEAKFQQEYALNPELDETITVKAEAGEGVTHLARRAVEKYLETGEIELSAEQKVYAEDYLRKIEGSYSLSVGQEASFATEDIEQAVGSAMELEEWQLQNLTQYTQNIQI